MSKLRQLAPRLGSLAPVIKRTTDAHGHSATAEPWRRWYKLARWARLRLEVFKRDRFTCQWERCGRMEPVTSLLVADHKQPHRGDPRLFWDKNNLQTLCKSCHDKHKQSLERRSGL